MSRHWARIDEVGFLFGMRLMYGLHRLLGRTLFRIALCPVVAVYWLTGKGQRRASQAYLARLRAQGVQVGHWASYRHFLAFAECMLDKLLVWNGGLDPARCRIESSEAIVAAIQAKQGGVLVTAHLGNFEVSRALAALRNEVRLHVLVHTHHAKRFNHLMAELNPASQINLVQVSGLDPATAAWLSARVAEGDWIVIAGDRVPVSHNSAVTQVPFLGAAAAFPTGPWVLASVLGAPVFLMWAVAEKSGFRIRFDAFREKVVLPRRQRGPALVALTTDFAQRLEAEVRAAPLQWFNFYDFWALPEGARYDIHA